MCSTIIPMSARRLGPRSCARSTGWAVGATSSHAHRSPGTPAGRGVVHFDTTLYGIEQAAGGAGYRIGVVSLRNIDRAEVLDAIDYPNEQGVNGVAVVAPQRSTAEVLGDMPTGMPVPGSEPAAMIGEVTAVFVANDRMALERAAGLRKIRVRVPEPDRTSWDSTTFRSRSSSPLPLTTIGQDFGPWAGAASTCSMRQTETGEGHVRERRIVSPPPHSQPGASAVR